MTALVERVRLRRVTSTSALADVRLAGSSPTRLRVEETDAGDLILTPVGAALSMSMQAWITREISCLWAAS